jgi:hypothetical protein
MSSAANYPPGSPDIPGLGAGSAPLSRHALGLPPGSVRAILALLVVGLICTLMLIPARAGKGPVAIPPYLIYLLFLVLGHYFAAHGHSISRPGSGHAAPLYLPRGFVRFVIIALLAGTVAWRLTQDPASLEDQLVRSVESIREQPLMPVILISGFFLGILVHVLVGKQEQAYWFQDFEAWVALLAVIGLCVDAMVYLVINPTLQNPLETSGLQSFVAAVIAFYFGARS